MNDQQPTNPGHIPRFISPTDGNGAHRGRDTGLPLLLGLLSVAVAGFAPTWVTFLVGLGATGTAGWVLSDAPVRAGVLVCAPSGVVCLLVGIFLGRATVVLPMVSGLMLALVASHIGAGLALRGRSRPEAPLP